MKNRLITFLIIVPAIATNQVNPQHNLTLSNWPNTAFIKRVNEIRQIKIPGTQTSLIAALQSPSTQTELPSYSTGENSSKTPFSDKYNLKVQDSSSLNVSPEIGGSINTYTSVLNLNRCQNKITVEDASGPTRLLRQQAQRFTR